MNMINYDDILKEDLKDPEYAAAYLNAAYDDGDKAGFLLAVRNVAEANNIKLSKIANEVGITRQSVSQSLSIDGNPTFENLDAMLNAVGFKINIAPLKQ